MSEKKGLQLFFKSLVIMTSCTYVLVTLGDPYRVFNKPWMLETKTHVNFYIEKLNLMKRQKNIEALILGSSTSQNYITPDVTALLKERVFHGSVAGSQTVGRMVLAHYALKNFSDLKTIIYISDFYEFNEQAPDFFDPIVIDNPQLSEYLPDFVRPWLSEDIEKNFWQIFSQVVIEKSINQVAKKISGNEKSIYTFSGDKTDYANANPVVMTHEYQQDLLNQAKQHSTKK